MVRMFGFTGAIRLLTARTVNTSPVYVKVDGGKGARIAIRPRDSDYLVAEQIFDQGQYQLGARLEQNLAQLAASWRAEGITPVVIDAGANVGYSAIEFARRLPGTIIIAIEANPQTADALKVNVADWPSIRPVRAALWSNDDGVSLVPGAAGSWSDQVSDMRSDVLVPSLTLQQAVDLTPSARPLLVKLDIEGSERAVCESSMDLLGTVPCVVIEPHDWLFPGRGCLVPLLAAMRERELDVLVHGENLVFAEPSLC